MEQIFSFIKSAYCWVKDWQTLITGILAFSGALWTISQIREQIRQVDNAAKDKQVRDERAARAVLPLGLSELSQYSQNCIKFLDSHFSKDSAIPQGVSAPQLPAGILPILQECVRSSDSQIASKIAILIGKLQIQHARLESLIARRSGEELLEHELANAVIDAADIYTITGKLYDYARNIKEIRKRLSSSELHSVLMLCGMSEDHPALKEIYRLEQVKKARKKKRS